MKKKLRIHAKAFLKTYMKGKQKKTFLQEQLLHHNKMHMSEQNPHEGGFLQHTHSNDLYTF